MYILKKIERRKNCINNVFTESKEGIFFLEILLFRILRDFNSRP